MLRAMRAHRGAAAPAVPTRGAGLAPALSAVAARPPVRCRALPGVVIRPRDSRSLLPAPLAAAPSARDRRVVACAASSRADVDRPAGQWQRSFWTAVDVLAILASVGGALSALLGLFSTTYALSLPLVLPIVSLIAALQREGLIAEARRRIAHAAAAPAAHRRRAASDSHFAPALDCRSLSAPIGAAIGTSGGGAPP